MNKPATCFFSLPKPAALLFLSCFVLFSCSHEPGKRPATAMDTGREFIRATLDGNFIPAEKLLLPDTLNKEFFDSYKVLYSRLPAEKKQAYKNASYTINTFTDLNDSETVINYSNSYMNKPISIKLVRRDRMWSVDFKYTYADTTSDEH